MARLGVGEQKGGEEANDHGFAEKCFKHLWFQKTPKNNGEKKEGGKLPGKEALCNLTGRLRRKMAAKVVGGRMKRNH